jgi:hypothetical protein
MDGSQEPSKQRNPFAEVEIACIDIKYIKMFSSQNTYRYSSPFTSFYWFSHIAGIIGWLSTTEK